MAFESVSPDINKLIEKRLLHDVTIERYLYRHSNARVVIDWDERFLEGNKKAGGLNPTTNLGAAMLDTDVTLVWKGSDLSANVECFRGYVARVSAEHRATHSYIVLQCVSYSQRADLIPRFRVWQSCTLLDVCQHIAGKEPLFQITSDAQSVLGGITIDLSVQYEETDFAYLSRMLHAWGIPMAVDDRAGKVLIGTPKVAGNGAFPAINWHCDSISLEGTLVPIDAASRNAGTGASGAAKGYVNKFNSKLGRSASDYLPRLDDDHLEERTWISERVYDAAFQANAAVYRLRWEGAVFDYSPGTGVKLGEQPLLVRSSHIRGGPDADTVWQEFVLQDFLAPLQLHRRRVDWPSRMLWATVTKNDSSDPLKQGRVQVEFDWEKLDATGGADQRCWLPTVTPYGGLKGKSGTSGFLSLPEIGERVLVQFLGDWDSDAVVIGAVRDFPREGFAYDPHETKRWQTPSGNQVTMTTKKDGTDIVRIKVKDKVILEGKITSSKETVIFDLCDSDADRIHFEKGSGPTRLDIFCSGEIYMSAAQKLLLEGGQVQIKSKMGPVNIDGAPMVMINCGPWSLQPLKREPDKAQEGSGGNAKKRAKPPKWTAMVSAAGGAAAAASQAQKDEKKTWIEIELKDELGNPIPNERYQIKLPDGSLKQGRLDANGRARVDGIRPGTAQVSFPDIDANEWRPA